MSIATDLPGKDQLVSARLSSERRYHRYRVFWRECLYRREYDKAIVLLWRRRSKALAPAMLLWHAAVTLKYLARESLDAVKGVITALRNRLMPHTGYSLMWRLRRSLGWARLPEGVNLVGYLRAEMGLGEAGRSLARTLETQAIPFSVFNIERGNPSRHQDISWLHKESNAARFDITVMTVAPDSVRNVVASLPRKLFRNRYTIAYWFWELPEIPDSWRPAFACVNEVWAATNFIQQAFAAKSPVPVYRVPVAVQLSPISNARREKFGLPPKSFLFLNTCDTRSYLERKNPLGAIRAFKQAFAVSDQHVALAVKINNPDHAGHYSKTLRQEAEEYPNIILLESVLTRAEMNSLLSLSDCYVSLHRSEGFGLGPAEAMSLGKPAILTNWSGNVDYMTPVNSAAVEYKLVNLEGNFGPYTQDQQWAEPDLNHAAHWMRRLVNEPALAESMGQAAKQTIRELLSPESVGLRIKQRLEDIRASW